MPETLEKPMKLSVIAPVYRNECHLRMLHDQVATVVQKLNDFDDYELILVDDGSPDKAWDVICELTKEDCKVKGIKFSRNFGQHHAITAGLDACVGDWAVVLDADGQDPPEVIATLWQEAKKGFDIISARRINRGDHFMRVFLSKTYHSLFQWLSGFNYDRDIANFRLINRKVIDALSSMRESFRGFPLHVHWLGFAASVVDFQQSSRWSGKSSYPFIKLLILAIDVAVVYSNRPLKISACFGFILAIISLSYIIYIIIAALIYSIPVPGWASLISSLWFFSGLIIGQIGILGIYICRILTEVQHRPIYIVEKKTNIVIKNTHEKYSH
jgi:glycosyltransferase involved in cell wall biosynthesis